MRVICDKCGSPYAIDDRLITPRGVRGMCPRCRHQQLIQREDTPTHSVTKPASPVRVLPAEKLIPVEKLIDDDILTARSGQPTQALPRCQSCGVELTDAFDVALGNCDACRQKQTGQLSVAAVAQALSRREIGPPAIPPPPLAKMDVAGRPGHVFSYLLDDAAASDQTMEMSDSQVQEAIGALSTPTRPAITAPNSLPLKMQSAAFRYQTGKTYSVRRIVWLWWGLGAALLLGGGTWVVSRLRSHPAHPVAEPEVGKALADVLPRWRMSYVDLAGTSLEHVQEGTAKLAADDPQSYGDAAEAFQRALLLDALNDVALVGYVEALALGPASGLDDASYEEALSLVAIAEQRAANKVPAWIAHAHLLLTHPEAPEGAARARDLATRAVGAATPEEKPAALTALGRSYLTSSVNLALQSLNEAISSPLAPKRALLYRALAHESGGQYQAAVADLQARLHRDPEQPEAIDQLARIYEEVGELGQARGLLQAAREKHPDDLHWVIALAQLSYQIEGKPSQAIALLSAAAHRDDRSDDKELTVVWTQLAAAQRAAGNLDAALSSAEQAVKLSEKDAAAHLQLFLLALQRSRPERAAAHLPFLQSSALAAPLRKHLEARLLYAQGKYDEAYDVFQQAATLDPRRVDSLLFAGAAAARSNRKDAAREVLTRALSGEPTRAGPAPLITDFYLRPGETLEGAEGQLLKLAQAENDVMPWVYEGVLRFHQGDLIGADKQLRRVIEADENNSLATAFQSLIALERGEKLKAQALGERAVDLGRPLAITHYALGAASAAAGDSERSQKELHAAEEIAPALLAVQVALGGQEVKARSFDSARARLLKVLSLDPSYVGAKRLLYLLDTNDDPKGNTAP